MDKKRYLQEKKMIGLNFELLTAVNDTGGKVSRGGPR